MSDLDEIYQDLSNPFVVFVGNDKELKFAKTSENKHNGKKIVITYDEEKSAKQFAETYKDLHK